MAGNTGAKAGIHDLSDVRLRACSRSVASEGAKTGMGAILEYQRSVNDEAGLAILVGNSRFQVQTRLGVSPISDADRRDS